MTGVQTCALPISAISSTPVVAIEEIAADVDFVLVMSVNPGFGGQSFIEAALDKIRRLRGIIDSRGFKANIEVDGGIGLDNIADVVRSGAEWIVAGSAVFGKGNPEEATRALRQKALELLTV